jgi:hypothetical protein
MTLSTVSSCLPQDHRVAIAGTPHAVEVVPGKTVADLPKAVMPRVGVADWLPAGDGTYRAVARIHEKFVRVTSRLIAQLGLGVSMQTLHRMGRAGFIDMPQVTPNTYLLSIESVYAHFRAVKDDPEFWARRIERDGVTMTRREWWLRSI